ncbi:MAG: cyclase family protein [Segetibacter sp.]
MNEWIDITATIHPQMMTWPGQPAVQLSKILSMANGDVCNLTQMSLSVHTGTHVDAPLHFLADGKDITTFPFDKLVGAARIIEIKDRETIKILELERANIQAGQRILFKTINSAMQWDKMEFKPDYVYLSTEAANYLAEKQISCIGIDYPSIAGYQKNEVPVHQVLLKAGIWIIEGLWLQNVHTGDYEMICLPLKIAGSDGAPARVIIRKIG